MDPVTGTKTAILVAVSLAIAHGLCGCEGLLSVDNLTERQPDDEAGRMLAPGP
jgi:hypothetical protein